MDVFQASYPSHYHRHSQSEFSPSISHYLNPNDSSTYGNLQVPCNTHDGKIKNGKTNRSFHKPKGASWNNRNKDSIHRSNNYSNYKGRLSTNDVSDTSSTGSSSSSSASSSVGMASSPTTYVPTKTYASLLQPPKAMACNLSASHPQHDDDEDGDKTNRNSFRPRTNNNPSKKNKKNKPSGKKPLYLKKEHSKTGQQQVPFFDRFCLLSHPQQYLTMDCEMVGVGDKGVRSALARVVMIDWYGRVVLDLYVRPQEPVTDYRTFVSGITEVDLSGENVVELTTCRQKVLQLLQYNPDNVNKTTATTTKTKFSGSNTSTTNNNVSGKFLIGHALENDLKALGIAYPWYLIRDTAQYKPFMQTRESCFFYPSTSGDRKPSLEVGAVSLAATHMMDPSTISATTVTTTTTTTTTATSLPAGVLWPRKLKDLCRQELNREIQTAGKPHCPIEDALAALDLYKSVRLSWEKDMQKVIFYIKQTIGGAEAAAMILSGPTQPVVMATTAPLLEHSPTAATTSTATVQDSQYPFLFPYETCDYRPELDGEYGEQVGHDNACPVYLENGFY
ncbi:hypothetical protein ACA910_008459 [Epithemia clementina (nom. ined.)]